MEVLKLTSIRLPKEYLEAADKLGSNLGYYRRSDILRVAIWLGLKLFKPGVIRRYLDMMWKEELGRGCFTLEDVLHAAGVLDGDKHGERE